MNRSRSRFRRLLLVAVLLLAACTGGELATSDLPDIDGEGVRELLADLERPAVVNVWASWCLPCRAEAPILAEAHRELGDEVIFIGIDVEDNRPDARDFIAEFDLAFDHYFDARKAVPAELGGFGVPITYFVEPGGEIVETHSGILDEEKLATMLDQLRS